MRDMPMSSKSQCLFAALACGALSCNLGPGDDSARPTPPEQQPRVVTAPAANPPSRQLTREHDAELRSTEVSARENTLVERFRVALASAPGSHLAFVDCGAEQCLARFSAPSEPELQQLLQGLERDFPGGLELVTRERLDPYQGRSFEADVTPEP